MGEIISEREYEEGKFWGLSTSIDLFNCEPDILRNGDKISQYIIELCELIDMKRFGEPVLVRFGADPRVQGYSVVQLIETSCVSGHFAEDSNSIYIDIFFVSFMTKRKQWNLLRIFLEEKE